MACCLLALMLKLFHTISIQGRELYLGPISFTLFVQFDTSMNNDFYFDSRSQGYNKARACAVTLLFCDKK